jgi:bifunctional non-homologous end joining protein LigD
MPISGQAKVRARALPRVEPVIPVLRAVPFDDPAWVFEPKYDGFRGLLYVTPSASTFFYSKRGLVLVRFAGLAAEVRDQLLVRDVILDGEVLALDPEGRADFRLLMRGQGVLHYAAFDVLWLNGRDLRTDPLTERKRRLERLIRTTTPLLSRVLTVPWDGRALFEAVQRLDLEGVVAKRKADCYSPTVTWYKIKNRMYTRVKAGGSCSRSDEYCLL